MSRPLPGFALAAAFLLCCPLWAQKDAAVALPKFEAADVHVSPEMRDPAMTGGVIPDRRFVIEQATMLDMVAYAYGMAHDHVVGGPPWIAFDHFDIYAKLPPGASPRDTKLMMRSLLADRFHLVAQPAVRPVPAYVLRVDKSGSKLKPADAEEASSLDRTWVNSSSPGMSGDYVVKFRNEPVQSLIYVIGDVGVPYIAQPVMDQSGLTDKYDFELRWTGDPSPGGISLFDALRNQLGLKVTVETAPAPVLVVEAVDHVPTPNLPGLEKVLPPLIAEFEVASVRPSRPDQEFTDDRIADRFTMKSISAHWLILMGWQLYGTKLVNEPKWSDDDNFDVQATVPADFILPFDVHGDRPAPRLGMNDRNLMLQALLRDRFRLKFHIEDLPGEAYSLVAANPRLKKSDASGPSGCVDAPAPGEQDPRIANPTIDQVITCRNVTMAQFARELWNSSGDYIQSPVLEATGLQGSYDFTLSFSGSWRFQSGDTGGDSNSAEPNGAISLSTALEKQLGLKLLKQKRPIQVFVIDHMEKPTEN
jgi:uncharacterized protein (TIGR03435 family)